MPEQKKGEYDLTSSEEARIRDYFKHPQDFDEKYGLEVRHLVRKHLHNLEHMFEESEKQRERECSYAWLPPKPVEPDSVSIKAVSASSVRLSHSPTVCSSKAELVDLDSQSEEQSVNELSLKMAELDANDKGKHAATKNNAQSLSDSSSAYDDRKWNGKLDLYRASSVYDDDGMGGFGSRDNRYASTYGSGNYPGYNGNGYAAGPNPYFDGNNNPFFENGAGHSNVSYGTRNDNNLADNNGQGASGYMTWAYETYEMACCDDGSYESTYVNRGNGATEHTTQPPAQPYAQKAAQKVQGNYPWQWI